MDNKDKELYNEAEEETALWDDELQEEDGTRIGRKVGPARFFELMGRDFGSFFITSLFFVLGIFPGMALLYFSIMAEFFPGALLGGILAGLIGAPLLCGLEDTMLRSLRDEAGLWWSRYRKAWKQNWKQSLLPGAILGAFFGCWGYIILHLPDMDNVPITVWISMVLGMVFAMILILLIAAQIVLVSLPLGTILKNAGLLIAGYFPKCLAAGIISSVYWAACFLYLPYSLAVLMLTGAWLPVLISLMLVYPVLNRALHIEESIEKKNAEKYKNLL